MVLRKSVFLLISLFFLQCKETTDSDKSMNTRVEDTGVNTYYNFLREYKDREIPEDKKSDIEKAKRTAEAEMTSIFKKPEKYGSDKIYLDNINLKKVKFIISEDIDLRLKFGKYLSK
jgi:hypothetical protein